MSKDRGPHKDSSELAQYFRGVFRLSTFYVGGQRESTCGRSNCYSSREQPENGAGVPTAEVEGP